MERCELRGETVKRILVIAAAFVYVAAAGTFSNPVHEHGPDPWVVVHDGYFYYMCTTGKNLTIWKSPTLEGLRQARGTVVYTPAGDYAWMTDLWAPELHEIGGKWYIYFAADKGRNNASHRIYIVENDAKDPLQGTWRMRGAVGDPTNRWAIDATVFENHGQLYMIWSGWPGGTDGIQNLYIARLKNPWTVDGERVMLTSPQLNWEKFDDGHRVYVNEGPEILEHGGKLFLTYSASGCWTDHYALGMLTASGDADLMNPASWRKSGAPVLEGSEAAHAVSTGHNGFFRSPDGKQDWIIYHANAKDGQGCGAERSSRAQPFTWKPDGTPDFGAASPVGTTITEPSGERAR